MSLFRRPRPGVTVLPEEIGASTDMAGRLTVAVVAWTVSHNAVGRAYLIAEALSRHFNVVLAGFNFGRPVWEPLRNAGIPIVVLPGGDLPEFARTSEQIAERLKADIVVACKPRLPSLLVGHLAKSKHNCPLFVDIDDHELAFAGDPTPLKLSDIPYATLSEQRTPHSDTWTRYSENFLDGVDGIFVSNPALWERFGGLEIPHARDETVFDPDSYNRVQLRSELGLTPEDRVVLFAGTPRKHKGVTDVLSAIARIADPRIKFLLVGKPQRALGNRMRKVGGDQLIVLGNRPFSDLPRYLACADAVCLLQDPDSPISKFQLPAKIVDALAFGLPVLATPVRPLQPLIDAGVVLPTSPETFEDDLRRVLSRPLQRDDAWERRRRYFLDHLSYAAIGETMAAAIRKACERPVPPNPALARVLETASRPLPRRMTLAGLFFRG